MSEMILPGKRRFLCRLCLRPFSSTSRTAKYCQSPACQGVAMRIREARKSRGRLPGAVGYEAIKAFASCKMKPKMGPGSETKQ